jgi:3-oxoacyl-[acyl-carrier protein] reductase
MTPAVEIDLAERVILITGAAGGIGQTLVRRGLAAGALIAAFDINPALHTLFPDQPRLLKLEGDAASQKDVSAALKQVKKKWNRLNVLVNNAGKVGEGRVESVKLEEWLAILHSNLTSVFLFSKHAIPMLKLTRGNIVNLSSTNGLTGGSHLSGPAYATAKAGIIALTKNLAGDLAKYGVRVNAIAPGPLDTPMLDRFNEAEKLWLKNTIPLREFGTAEDAANLVYFLASSAAKHITGVTVSLSGGLVMH